MSTAPKVLVLGSGVAGLCAAYELAERGCSVTVVEAAPFPGGRTSSFTDAKGRGVDTGLHVVADHYANLLEMLSRLGVSHRLLWVGEHTYLRSGREPMAWGFRSWPAPFHLLRPFARMPLSLGARLRLGRVGLQVASYSQEDLAELDSLSYAEWHRRRGLQRDFTLELAEAAADAATFLTVEEAAARPVLSWIKYLVRHPRSGDVGLWRGTLAECLVEPLCQALARKGGQLLLRHAVVGLEGEGQRVKGVWVSPAETSGPVTHAEGRVPVGGAGRKLLACDFVVSAMNVQSLRAVLPPEWVRAAGLEDAMRLTTTPAMSLLLWFDRPIRPVPAGAPLVTGCAFRDFVDLAMLGRQPRGAPGSVYQFVITRARSRFHDPDEAIVSDVMRDLRSIWPGAQKAQVVDYALERIGAAMFAAVPGAHQLRPPARTRLGNFFLAGDWTRHELNASMEGAALSGRLAADALLRDLGQAGLAIHRVPEPTVMPALRKLGRPFRGPRSGASREEEALA
ncbi:FAD-dependent oxidoreductase [Archangium violaceum]|uniref:hydroxysqualene dehydroxylase n=1 Tax=Archangium violaceum TaxID=83451 RepID=UPI00195038A8|nr:FAD-dependent oxidoreductase [Archangium violaceum]QRN97977.1 FAD-dependent oxidoreductase [Archangium violaceum]